MDTFATIRTYPMTHSPMMNMPLPSAFSQHGLRTHSYSSLVGANMMINAFDMVGSNGQAQYLNRKTDAEIGWFAAEASEILPAIFSAADCYNNTATITVTAANEPGRIIASRLYLEEHQIDAPADAFCYTLVVANGKEVPTPIHGEISGLVLPPTAKPGIHGPGCNGTADGCWPLQRLFNGNYAVNLTHSASSGNWSFADFVDASATNVYRLGCYVHDHNCTKVTNSKVPGGLVRPGHPFTKSQCLVLNGGFEFVSLSAGANNALSMPGKLGDICCADWKLAYYEHGCCADNDDRTRITACAADPKVRAHLCILSCLSIRRTASHFACCYYLLPPLCVARAAATR
jgi:hypothetical protein